MSGWLRETSHLVQKCGQSTGGLEEIDNHIRRTFPVKFKTEFQKILDGSGIYRRPKSVKSIKGTEGLEIEI